MMNCYQKIDAHIKKYMESDSQIVVFGAGIQTRDFLMHTNLNVHMIIYDNDIKKEHTYIERFEIALGKK